MTPLSSITRVKGALVLVAILLGMAGPALGSYGEEAQRRALESKIVLYTNAVRAKHGLQPLSSDVLLAAAARGHSEEMMTLGYFSHTSPTASLKTVSDRVALAGSSEVEVGENLAYYEGYSLDAVAARVIQDWMDSPGHRANLLKGTYNTIGLGVAFNGRKCLVTQVFASSRITVAPVQTALKGGQIEARLSGRVRNGARELGIFDGRTPLEKVKVAADGTFSANVTLRANSGTHSLSLGLVAGRTGGCATYEIYNSLPIDTNAVAARHK
ncbi:MAG: hypothetical protein FJX76_15505 [Armatimonadetes bacterium]|nr:hypothetical protein [Armatimonadota bacterium]